MKARTISRTTSKRRASLRVRSTSGCISSSSRSGDKLQAGTYRLPKGLSTGQIVNRITGVAPVAAAPAPSVNVFIKEGTRLEEIPAILKAAGMNKAATEFLTTAKNVPPMNTTFATISSRSARRGKPASKAFSFPDTYRFTVDDDSTTVIKVMLDNFGKKLQQARDAVPAESRSKLPEGANNSLYNVLVIASIVEREAAADSDRPDIACRVLQPPPPHYRRCTDAFAERPDRAVRRGRGGRLVATNHWRRDENRDESVQHLSQQGIAAGADL